MKLLAAGRVSYCAAVLKRIFRVKIFPEHLKKKIRIPICFYVAAFGGHGQLPAVTAEVST